ncbi:MAG: hypothetical protein DRR16_29385 [Candidatus Parabeggiatoa sp. nov. 3]|nr:MAG: hypothetical protein DRR00_27055 [Gammaproteobacteria bacterium]RKZ59197.1 MAG: hypothetical protein DRQ99_24105 [Gammaproteobacteria bacterium]RKZ77569.1 MAG: hypothetical protein DRR16_29385 [Gammaproteobacteria bacterium]
MNDTDKSILDTIKMWIWSGFYDRDEVNEMIDDILEDDCDEAFLRSAIGLEFDKKSLAEASWPEETDCDRLDRAFESLNSNGIIALHNAGYTLSDGITGVSEVLDKIGSDCISGYCFYHGQDVKSAVAGGGLMIAFGDLGDDKPKKAEIGATVRKMLEKHGFNVEWNGDTETRLNIPELDWKRKLSV